MKKYKTKPKFTTKEERVTLCKRKRAILKKCMEISLKCSQDVYLVMLDRKTNKLVELNSTPEFELKAVITAMETLEEKGIKHRKF